MYSLSNFKIWETFRTRNIMPDGSEVTVRGPGQLAQLEHEYGVQQIDDDAPPPQTKFREFYDPAGGPEPEGGAAPIDPNEFK